MPLVLKDRVKEGTATSGTGTVVLLGAAPGYQSFAVIGNGNTTYYTIAGGNDWEVGIGTYYSGNTSLSRDTILASSNSNAAVVLSGTYDVFVTYPAEESVYLSGGNLNAGGLSNISFSALTANLASINTVTLTSGTISATPNAATDIVNKTYVDALVSSGVHYHTPVQYEIPASQGNLVAIYNQPNGAGNGVGATLTNNGANAAFVADGNTVVVSDRILVYNQSNAVQNGVYVVTVVGAPDSPGPGAQWVLTRSDDTDSYGFDSPQALSEGSTFFVQGGTTGKGETYTCNTQGVITFGTSNISFVQVSSAQIYSNGTGLTLSNTTFSISNTAVVAGTYGDAGNVATFTVNAQGQLTNATNTTIVIPSSSVTGLGTMAVQNATSVAITGGSINGTLIGNATPSTGAFTNLSASGTVSGVGFANYLNSPPTIGGVTANTGAFTSLSAANTLTASANVVTSQLTGYLYGNNSSPLTASTTIPNTAITGLGTMSTQNANAVAITGGTINNVSLSNVTYGGLGTMATQNANAVAITGGNINGTVIGDTGPSTAVFTNMNTTTGNATTINVTNSTIANLVTTGTTLLATSSGNVGIGTNTPVVKLQVAYTANVPDSTLLTTDAVIITAGNVAPGYAFVVAGNTSTQRGVFKGTRARGTLEAPIAPSANDSVVSILGSIYNGTSTLATAAIEMEVDGTVLANAAPQRIRFLTGNATSRVERARITSSGNFGIGNTAPASPLTVAGVIESTTGGVKFPDGTTQTTAATAGALTAGNSSIIINNVNITANATIAAGQNGFSVGPVTTANGVTVTIASGQQWVVI